MSARCASRSPSSTAGSRKGRPRARRSSAIASAAVAVWRDLLGLGRGRAEDTVAPPEPILRRLSGSEVAILEVADLFNASTYRRTVGGIAKSLGEARASIVALSGDAGEMAVTVAWDLSWYQYRVSPDSGQPVRLERRGHELDELEETFKEWNAHVEDEGRLVPEIARL